jgi:Uma2 family endonuclease
MSVVVQNGRDLLRVPAMPVHRISVDEYHRMLRAGVFTEDDRVELLEGWIVNKMGHNPPHDSTIDLTVGELEPILPAEWFLRVQSAITTNDSEPEPDIAVVRGPRGRYVQSHPRPRNIGLLIEVSDTTLQGDREDKGPLYARVKVPVYWIINLPEAQVEVYTEPSGPCAKPAYRQERIYGLRASIPVVLGGKEVGRVVIKNLFPE